jgi:hypothetical protein
MDNRKSCSGTPSAQGAFAIKRQLPGAPAVFDDLPRISELTRNSPKYF